MAHARATQVTALTARSGAPAPRTTQVAALAVYQQAVVPRVAQLVMLLAHRPPAAAAVRATQAAALVVSEGLPVAKTTQLAQLVVYGTGVPGELTTRAWTFDLDGHTFYVLNLGEEGTFVYDTSTDEWCEFETSGYGTWNMYNGISWNGRIIAADLINPFVWELDPDAVIDEDWRPIEHAVTGAIPLRTREAKRNDALRLFASVGLVGVDGATVRLRFSDDQGRTWSDYYEVVLPEGDFSQELSFRSLGLVQSPGRVYEISDEGGLIRIDGATADIDGVDDNGS